MSLEQTLQGHEDSVESVAISADSETLVSGSIDRIIKVWNLNTGELEQTLQGHEDSVFSVAISADGRTLFSGSGDETIKVWNLTTGELEQTPSRS